MLFLARNGFFFIVKVQKMLNNSHFRWMHCNLTCDLSPATPAKAPGLIQLASGNHEVQTTAFPSPLANFSPGMKNTFIHFSTNFSDFESNIPRPLTSLHISYDDFCTQTLLPILYICLAFQGATVILGCSQGRRRPPTRRPPPPAPMPPPPPSESYAQEL